MNSKVIIVGASGVGKTAFVKRIKTNIFESKYIASIGAEVTEYEGLDLWDTAGQEKFCGLKDGYYIGAKYAIVMFDLASLSSLKSAATYIISIRKVCDCKIILVGTKLDYPGEKLTNDIINYMTNKLGNIETYIKISSKEGTKCLDLIDFIKGLEDENVPGSA